MLLLQGESLVGFLQVQSLVGELGPPHAEEQLSLHATIIEACATTGESTEIPNNNEDAACCSKT